MEDAAANEVLLCDDLLRILFCGAVALWGFCLPSLFFDVSVIGKNCSSDWWIPITCMLFTATFDGILLTCSSTQFPSASTRNLVMEMRFPSVL